MPRSHTATLRHDAKARNRIREEKNAALAVLTNWELLMTYALANGEVSFIVLPSFPAFFLLLHFPLPFSPNLLYTIHLRINILIIILMMY